MRTAGVLDRSSVLDPHDHAAWCGGGPHEFVRLAGQVFATATETERLVLVGDLDRVGAEVEQLFADQLERGRLRMVDVAEAYRPVVEGGPGHTTRQLDAFRAELDTALAEGCTGLRVVADNTAMLTGDDELERRWLAWEQLTDRWQVRMPITGVCYFDRTQVPARQLVRVVGLHPLCSGTPAPSLRVYHDTEPGGGTVLMLDGAVEAFDADELRDRLRTELTHAPDDADGPELTVDLSRTVYLHHRALEVLEGASVRVQHAPTIVRRLNELLPGVDRLRLD